MNEGIGGDRRWNLIALLGHGVRFRFFIAQRYEVGVTHLTIFMTSIC